VVRLAVCGVRDAERIEAGLQGFPLSWRRRAGDKSLVLYELAERVGAIAAAEAPF
jgi:hypothetical protein